MSDLTTTTRLVPTPVGDGRITTTAPPRPRAVLALGHGAGGGTAARDLAALAAALPPRGVAVALVEQPWRVAGRRLAPASKTLDTAWTALWAALDAGGSPVVAGGRSAGARVACRTAGPLGAAGVLALAFPLHPPGRPERSRAQELLGAGPPTLVVQGERDPFGTPEEFALPGWTGELVGVPHADHGFAVPKRAPVGQEEVLRAVADAVADWLDRVLPGG
ncbi:hypothetical protein GCM10027168_67410 [Streptomyces capparidis]